MPITHVVPVQHPETASVVRRRRQVVAGVSLLGTGLLGLSLSTKPDSKEFYGLTAAVAATWTAGGLLSGPLHLGWIQGRDQHLRRPVLTPVATGVGAFGFFYGCALVARSIPVLDRAIGKVLVFAEEGSGPLVVATTLANGLGEEVFFRGAMYAALDADRAVAASTARLHAGDRVHPQPRAGARGRGDGHAVRPAAPGVRRPAGPGAHPPDVVHPDGALPPAAVPARPPGDAMTRTTDVVVVGAGPGRARVRPRADRPGRRRDACWRPATRWAAGSAPTTSTATRSTAASRC